MLVLCACAAYFAGKLLFSRNGSFSGLQFVNQLLIFGLLYGVFRLFAMLDSGFEKHLSGRTRRILEYLSSITLEIYAVQYVLIDLLRPRFSFPVNWFVLTGSILAAAALLHGACQFLRGLPARKKISC